MEILLFGLSALAGLLILRMLLRTIWQVLTDYLDGDTTVSQASVNGTSDEELLRIVAAYKAAHTRKGEHSNE